MILHGNTLQRVIEKIENLKYHPKYKYAVFEEKHLEQIKRDLKKIGHYLWYVGNRKYPYIFKMTEKERENDKLFN